jgi:hypothetical protein
MSFRFQHKMNLSIVLIICLFIFSINSQKSFKDVGSQGSGGRIQTEVRIRYKITQLFVI